MDQPSGPTLVVKVPLPAELPESVNGEYGLLCQAADNTLRSLHPSTEDQILYCEMAEAHFKLVGAALRNALSKRVLQR